jgi:nicotinamidase-related amidase
VGLDDSRADRRGYAGVPALARYIPPASVIDKQVYAPWMQTDLHQRLQKQSVHTLIISGGETDVCVLATVLGAVDLGYRVVLAKDALCSSSDAAHDAAIDLYHQRFSIQVEPADTETILRNWHL